MIFSKYYYNNYMIDKDIVWYVFLKKLMKCKVEFIFKINIYNILV